MSVQTVTNVVVLGVTFVVTYTRYPGYPAQTERGSGVVLSPAEEPSVCVDCVTVGGQDASGIYDEHEDLFEEALNGDA